MNKKRAELAVCAATEQSQIIRFVFFCHHCVHDYEWTSPSFFKLSHRSIACKLVGKVIQYGGGSHDIVKETEAHMLMIIGFSMKLLIMRYLNLTPG